MDGVLADSQILHSQIEADLLARYGVLISPEEITRRFSGVMLKDFFVELLGSKCSEETLQSIIEEKRKTIFDLISADGVAPIPGAQRLVETLFVSGYSLAIGSASSLALINLIVGKLGLTNSFHAIASGHEVLQGKPSPDVFLLAAQRLGVRPNECLVIEDGVSGMEAARRAKMKCVGLVPSEALIEYPADILVTSLDQITVAMIRSL